MTCEEARTALLDAVLGEGSHEIDVHLSRCGSCRATLSAERDLLARIEGELTEAMNVQPSPAFLPAVRQRVAATREGRATTRRRWLVPALATLAGVLVAGHLLRDSVHGSLGGVSPAVRQDARQAAPVTDRAPSAPDSRPSGVEPVTPSPVAPEVRPASWGRALPESRRADGPSRPPDREEASASIPRVLVPEEDARVVRRLARRLRGRAARAAVLGPGVEGPFDFTLKPIGEAPDLASNAERGPAGLDPAPRHTPSFDRMFEEAGRET